MGSAGPVRVRWLPHAPKKSEPGSGSASSDYPEVFSTANPGRQISFVMELTDVAVFGLGAYGVIFAPRPQFTIFLFTLVDPIFPNR